MSPAKIYLIVFGILTLIGGVMGYVKASSIASLVAGGVAGILLLVAAFLIPGQAQAGLILGLVVSVLLLGRFGPVLLKGGSFMPAGLMVLLSIPAIVLTLLALLRK